MNRLMSLVHIIWPWLEKRSEEEERQIEARKLSDAQRIEALKFGRAPTLALDEIRRLADSEAERRRGTEQKAATYLPLVAALIPLVLTVVGALWEKKAGGAPTWANMILLGLAVAYTAAAGWWAFRVLKVATSHEPGLGDFEASLDDQSPTATLAGRLLLHTRRNQDGIDWKVSCIKMAHEFLLRAFLAFSFLLMLNIGWLLVGAIAKRGSTDPELHTAADAFEALARVEDLADQLRRAPAWRILDKECQARTLHRHSLKYDAGPVAIENIAAPFLQGTKVEPISTRLIRLDCAGNTVAQMRVWFRPSYQTNASPAQVLPFSLAAPATVSMTRTWPSAILNRSSDRSKLPPVLLRQIATAHAGDGAPIGYVITNIAPGSIDLEEPPSRQVANRPFGN